MKSPEQLEARLLKSYPELCSRVDGEALSIFADFPKDRTGYPIAEYWSHHIAYHFTNWLLRQGYWAEWQNPEHIKLWKL